MKNPSTIVQTLMMRPEKDHENSFVHFLCLGLGLSSCNVKQRWKQC